MLTASLLKFDNDWSCCLHWLLLGTYCEQELSLCQDQCENGGTCFEAFDNYVCLCEYPAYGRHCEELPDPCETERPCAYGNCTSMGQDYTCDCFAGNIFNQLFPLLL